MPKTYFYKILLTAEFVILLALLPGCFGKEKRLDSFFGEDISGLAAMVDSHTEFQGDRMALSPGVYQIRIWGRPAEGERIYVMMECDGAFHNSLRNNGVWVLPADEYAEFDVYVTDKVPSAYVRCSFYGTDADSIVKVEVWRTNKGNRMLLFIVMVCFCVLDFLILFRKHILEGKVTGKQQAVFWTLTAGVLLAYFPYLTDYFFIGADTIFHLGRISFLADALKQGFMYPVRVEGTWMYGHGYAAPLFYGDLFLLIPAFLQMLGFSIMNAYKLFLFLVLAATAAISYHCFRKCVRDEYAALAGSMVYLLIPYHIYNLYNRGAVGEYLAMAFMPLVCCGMYLLYTGDAASKEYKKYKWYLIWGMSAILQSHLITTEMTAVLMAVICAVFWKKTFRKQTFCQLLEAVGAVLAINAWFWLPMLYMLNADTYHLQEIISENGQNRGVLFAGFFQMLPEKGSAQTGMWHCEPVQIGAGGIMSLLICAAWQYRRRKRGSGREHGDRMCLLLAVFCAVLLVMSTRYLPWDAVMKLPVIGGIVASLQFPSRWMSPATVIAAMFTAFFIVQVRKNAGMLIKTAAIFSLAVTLASSVYHVNSIVFEFGPTWLHNAENMGTVGVVCGEYLLEGVSDLDYYNHKPVSDEGLRWTEYDRAGTNVTVTLENTTEELLYIEIPLTGYKGYALEASAESDDMPFISEDRGAHGDLRMAVPAGYQGTVQIFYEGFAVFRAAEALSLTGMAVMLAFYLYGRFCRYRMGKNGGRKHVDAEFM